MCAFIVVYFIIFMSSVGKKIEGWVPGTVANYCELTHRI